MEWRASWVVSDWHHNIAASTAMGRESWVVESTMNCTGELVVPASWGLLPFHSKTVDTKMDIDLLVLADT